MNKKVLVLGATGAMGQYLVPYLVEMGYEVDGVSLDAVTSDNPKLKYIRANTKAEGVLDSLLANNYDCIVDFMVYDRDTFADVADKLLGATDHYVYLSSYRVYANEQIPVTETAPRLLDVTEDEEFLAVEDYALPKARCEDFLNAYHKGEAWTVVRPVISFSHRRLDLFVYSNDEIREQVETYGALRLPIWAQDLVAGIDWAGNSGKLIANLLCKKETFGEAYTVSTAQNLTWKEVAELYTRLFGYPIEWCAEEDFIKVYPCVTTYKKWLYLYDRKYSRKIDNRKILAATGLSSKDFLSVEEGLCVELANKQMNNN